MLKIKVHKSPHMEIKGFMRFLFWHLKLSNSFKIKKCVIKFDVYKYYSNSLMNCHLSKI